MSNPKIFLPYVICIISLVIALNPYRTQEPDQQPAAISPRELVILYAKTRMELAQAELDWTNEKSAGSIPKPRIERRRSDLAVAKEQYTQAKLASSGGAEKVRLCHAEEKVRLARLDLETAHKLRATKSVSEFALKRAELNYKLAELKLALLKNPENYVTLIEAMQAQIDRMDQELLSLDLRLTKLETGAPIGPTK